MQTSANGALLMRFKPVDTPTGVSRDTLARLAKQLGFERESEALHYAARRLAEEILPKYEADDAPLTAKQIAAIKKAAGPRQAGRVKSSLFE